MSSSTTKAKNKTAKQKSRSKTKGREVQSHVIGGQVVSAPKKAGKSKKKSKSEKGAKKSGKTKLTAKTADPHALYQASVQSPDVDVEFLAKTYRRLRGRAARHLREDFCGTAFLLSEWLRAHPDNSGEGFDIDAPTIQWGRDHNYENIDNWEDRVQLFEADVREPSQQPPDIRNSPNFSWMIFTERQVLLEYFRGVQADLAEDGIFVLDIYGGPEAFEEMEDKRKVKGGFSYVWEQKSYHPATGDYHCAIHFRFPDGTELRNVYDYRWRLWSLPELRDLLIEAGFSQVDSYWEGTDEDGVSGNGVYKRSAKGENCPAWVTWVVAQK